MDVNEQPLYGGRRTNSTGDLLAQRTRREKATASMAELLLAQKRGELISAREIEQAQFAIARQVRDRMLSIPDRIAAIVAAEADVHKVRELLTEEIRLALTELSNSLHPTQKE